MLVEAGAIILTVGCTDQSGTIVVGLKFHHKQSGA
jgi:hypothetical protein